MRNKIEELTLEHFRYFPEILGFEAQKLDDLNIINCGLGSSMFNIAFGGRDVKVDQVMKIFKGQPFAWWIPPSAGSATTSQALQAAGLVIEASEEIMVCDLNTSAFAGPALEAQSSSLQIKPVLTDPQVQDFTNVLSVYDPTAEAFYSQLKAPHLTSKERLFVGYTDDVPVIIAILFTDQDMSGIFSLITKDSHRCKGFGTEMMKFLMKFAKDNGSNYACLSSSSPEGYKIYQKLGFQVMGNFECFESKGT